MGAVLNSTEGSCSYQSWLCCSAQQKARSSGSITYMKNSLIALCTCIVSKESDEALAALKTAKTENKAIFRP